MIDIKLKETERSFKNKITNAAASIIERTLFRKRYLIERDVKNLIPIWIKTSPEMISLANDNTIGSLSAQLGLYYGTERQAVDAIAKAVADSTEINLSKINRKTLEGGINIKVMPQNFKTLLDLPEGQVGYPGGDISWLEWLLFEGYSTIVIGYGFVADIRGRSLGGFMRTPGVWRVPPEVAGIQSDNFVTRALTGKDQEQQIQRIIEKHLT